MIKIDMLHYSKIKIDTKDLVSPYCINFNSVPLNVYKLQFLFYCTTVSIQYNKQCPVRVDMPIEVMETIKNNSQVSLSGNRICYSP